MTCCVCGRKSPVRDRPCGCRRDVCGYRCQNEINKEQMNLKRLARVREARRTRILGEG